MAAGKSAAVEAYERAEDDMRKHQVRVADARKAAARELGDAVLSTGAGKLPMVQLKAILAAVVAMGGEQALLALGVSPASRAAANRRDGASRIANGSIATDAKDDGESTGDGV